MNNDRIHELVAGRLAGELQPHEADELNAALEADPDLAAEVEAMGALWGRLEPVTMTTAEKARIRGSLLRPPRIHYMRVAWVAAAAAIIVMVGWPRQSTAPPDRFQHPVAAVRLEAIQSMAMEGAGPRLMSVLRSDPSTAVRLAALDAMLANDSEPVDPGALFDVLATESSAHVQMFVLEAAMQSGYVPSLDQSDRVLSNQDLSGTVAARFHQRAGR